MRTPNYSRSGTFRFLTEYAEGILLARMLKSKAYDVRQDNPTLWYVIHRDNYEKNDFIVDSIYPRFKRVRQVSLLKKQGVDLMSCTCGSICRWGMPCPHSIAVLSSLKQSITLSNIHYRWYKVLAYSIHDDENIIDDTIKRKLMDVQLVMNSIVCPIRRSWIGFPLDENQVVATTSYVYDDKCNHDEVFTDMIEILDHNISKGPFKYQPSNDVVRLQHSTNQEQTRNTVEVQSKVLSEAEIYSNATNISSATVNLYEDLKSKFVSMWDVVNEKITNLNDLNYIRSFLESYDPTIDKNGYQKRFNSLWWIVEKKIKTTQDFECLHSLLENFHLNENSRLVDPSIVNSTIDMVKNKKRKKMFFER